MNKVTKATIVALALASLAAPTAFAQQNTGEQIVGPIDATQKAVKELQGELERRPLETMFNASDYKDWNRRFRILLDDATVNYVGRLDREIAPGLARIADRLKPLKDRLYSVEHEPSIRDDQRQLLLGPLRNQLDAESKKAWSESGPGLTSKYREIYRSFLERSSRRFLS